MGNQSGPIFWPPTSVPVTLMQEKPLDSATAWICCSVQNKVSRDALRQINPTSALKHNTLWDQDSIFLSALDHFSEQIRIIFIEFETNFESEPSSWLPLGQCSGFSATTLPLRREFQV